MVHLNLGTHFAMWFLLRSFFHSLAVNFLCLRGKYFFFKYRMMIFHEFHVHVSHLAIYIYSGCVNVFVVLFSFFYTLVINLGKYFFVFIFNEITPSRECEWLQLLKRMCCCFYFGCINTTWYACETAAFNIKYTFKVDPFGNDGDRRRRCDFSTLHSHFPMLISIHLILEGWWNVIYIIICCLCSFFLSNFFCQCFFSSKLNNAKVWLHPSQSWGMAALFCDALVFIYVHEV